MKLFIMRHGEASFDAPSDAQRVLTPRGAMQTLQVFEALAAQLGVDVFGPELLVWQSTLVRAQQSAKIGADLLGYQAQTQDFLCPDSRPERVLDALLALPVNSAVLLVSHQPLVGNLLSLLCEGHLYQPYPFTTSELLYLECELPARGLAQIKARWRAD